jgi:DNA-binding response OmpR family regulator
MRVLVVEDYAPVRGAVLTALRDEGWSVDAAGDGSEGLRLAQSGGYDVIILDVMLPSIGGFEVLRLLREREVKGHVMMLTARDEVSDRVQGLDLGADDYMVKPFAMEELVARVRALMRREYDKKAPLLRIGHVEIRTTDHAVFVAGEQVEFTAREYALLEYFAHRVGEVVTREEIKRHVYDDGDSLSSNVIDVYVGYLRKKVEREGYPPLLKTRRGEGYIFGQRQSAPPEGAPSAGGPAVGNSAGAPPAERVQPAERGQKDPP